jgi:Protein of unknown function (DUF2934)
VAVTSADLEFLHYLVDSGMFPALAVLQCLVTSRAERRYNCIAWAAGETRRWWWPGSGQTYWPPWAPRQLTLEAFVRAFEGLGYSICDSTSLEPAVEKVILYALGDVPKHSARQLADGRWTSKLGEERDIIHTLTCLDGPCYGVTAVAMKRPRPHNFPDEVVAPLAYEIWEQEGRPQGRYEDHWLRALQALMKHEEAGRTT